MTPTILAIMWAVCAPLGYAICLGHFQRKYKLIAQEKYREDLGLAIFCGLLGPIGLLSILLTTGFAPFGLQWK